LKLQGETADWFYGALMDGGGEGWFPASLVARSRPVRGELSTQSFSSNSLTGNTLATNAYGAPPSVSFSSASGDVKMAQEPDAPAAVECVKGDNLKFV
jgi:hypothetical protein